MKKKRTLPTVAYFCMEFGLHEELKTYSGGLGILAGDTLKAARDLKYPVVGIGILWRQGYVKQTFGPDGRLYDSYTDYNYDFLRDTRAEAYVRIRGRQLRLKVWKCTRFHNAPLYLLDANLPENRDKLITGQLYGWFNEERIAQEIILGIGGVRALRALRIPVDIYHFNDSHPVLAATELLREKMDNDHVSFSEAWRQVKKSVVFTTHTPVPAGNEVHEHELLRYMGAYNGLTYGQMLKIGGDPFGMTVAGLRLSKRANGVAELHGKTARSMWADVSGAAPIISITNGVHSGTWQDPRIAKASRAGGDLRKAHTAAKLELIKEVKARTGMELDPDVLTIGFGRRSTGYKRPDLIFRKKKIIEPLLLNGKLQLIFSGKAHPHDAAGKENLYRLKHLEKQYPGRVILLENYDMRIARFLTRGADVWLNNPKRPMEASGTSGMKAAMNGVLNLSVLDGWWPEGCRHGINGWQIGNGYEGDDADRIDSDSLYRVLTREVIPAFYNNRTKWISMMRASIKMASGRFSAETMVKNYYRLLYRR